MSERIPPHSLQAEESVIGAMLLSKHAIESVIDVVATEDFYAPSHQRIFQAISDLYRHGDPVDVVTVADRLEQSGGLNEAGGPGTLIELQGRVPSTSSAGRYAKTVADYSVLRRVIAVALDAVDSAYDLSSDPGHIVEAASVGFSAALSGLVGAVPEDLWVLDDFLDRPLDHRPQWVIPGLLREGWRAMVVAGEGIGKTVLLRQIGIAAAQGIHPLAFNKIPPVRVLIVDLENPEDSVHDVCTPIRVQTELVSEDYDRERAYLWHRPGGIDLRSRRDRSDLETVIATVRPDLVCLGPVYKAYSVSASESDEQAAKEIMQVFDDLRTRYQFALLLEHHSPHGEGSKRALRPYGSSLWLRWPELGLSLTPKDPRNLELKVGRWRGDRLENSWPSEIRRSEPWLWRGVWPDGTFQTPGEPAVPVESEIRSGLGPGDDLSGFDPESEWDDPLY